MNTDKHNLPDWYDHLASVLRSNLEKNGIKPESKEGKAVQLGAVIGACATYQWAANPDEPDKADVPPYLLLLGLSGRMLLEERQPKQKN